MSNAQFPFLEGVAKKKKEREITDLYAANMRLNGLNHLIGDTGSPLLVLFISDAVG